jgi:transposase
MGGADQMAQTTHFVGLDVHARQTHAGVLERDTGELWRRRLVGDPLVVLDLLERLGADACAVYEAGPTGFGFARAAAGRGLDVRVCAPGLIPRKPSERVKTDARDAERLARLLAAGGLFFVRIRAWRRSKCGIWFAPARICAATSTAPGSGCRTSLRRRALRFEGPGKNWTRPHRRWLGALEFDDRASAVTFADYLAGVCALEQRRDAVDAALVELAPECAWAQTIARLRCLRGIDTLAAVRRAVRRDRRLRAFCAPAPAGRLPGSGAVRAHLR